MRRSRAWTAVRPGLNWRTTASAPAACGDAIEVPRRPQCSPSRVRWLSVAGTRELSDEAIHSPGAEISGFSRPSRVGPFPEKEEIPPIEFEIGRQVVGLFGSAFGQQLRVT